VAMSGTGRRRRRGTGRRTSRSNVCLVHRPAVHAFVLCFVRRPSGLTITRSRTSLAYFVLPHGPAPPGTPVLRSQLRFAPTYTSCIDQPFVRLCFALSAVICFVVLSADCTNNTYDTAPSPSQPTHVRIDDAYATGIALAMERQLTARWCYQ
jgi:hypothetical protein